MPLTGKRIGFGLTAAQTLYHKVFPEIKKLINLGAQVTPIVTYSVETVDTVYGKAKDHMATIEQMTKQKIITTIHEAEQLGPKKPLDCMVIAPLTGYSLSKFANGMNDSPVLFAAKSTLRNNSPVVLGISTNDALSLNSINIMKLLTIKNIYFIPFGQDQPFIKPHSLVSAMDLLVDTVCEAIEGKQYQPILIPYEHL